MIMSEVGRILIADDEETFLISTADLLRDEGYQVTAAPDAFVAADALRKSEFDLLIADIKMPGNTDLEFVRSLPKIAAGMPVILTTGHPTLQSAIASIRLPVVGYLLKPIEFSELLAMVRPAVEYVRVHRAVDTTRQRLTGWQSDLERLQMTPGTALKLQSSNSVDTFIQLARDNLVSTFTDLIRVTQALSGTPVNTEVCHLMKCPRLDQYSEAIREAVRVLEKTKNAFKSRELGELRKMLEATLAGGPLP
jgi:DNA-binding response OmpR family regulator